MSVQFGKIHFDGKPVDARDLERVRPLLAPYGPDAEGSMCIDSIGILHRAFHTTAESRRERQPYTYMSGAVFTWDGRIDNREELIERLAIPKSLGVSDLELVAAAYQRWGTGVFPRLIGDWALSVWDPRDRSLLLAKDFLGTRHLYYSIEKATATWCTILDPLVLLADRSFELEQEYLAGWLSYFPATHLTPYVGVRSVPPASFVRITRGTQKLSRYWDFDPAKKIRNSSDGEYEEQFRALFSESVRRRLRSDNPVLAELSGGTDSSSIVCMADRVIAAGGAATPRLDTISYYDDSEPNWNERPYFTKVEEKRGRAGCHIASDWRESLPFNVTMDRFAATPGSSVGPSATAEQSAACMKAQQNRVLLSGIGGDEVMGGVPTPAPELENLLAGARFRTLARQLKVWALDRRTPWLHLLLEAAAGFLPLSVFHISKPMRPAPWLDRNFIKDHRLALAGYPTRLKLFGPLPSFQENLATLDLLRRQMHCEALPTEPTYEKRYPYLDRELLEFLYAIPREQLVRPGQRRSLMRRALVGIVPGEVLNRKRKAFASSLPAVLLTEWIRLFQMPADIAGEAFGFVEAEQLLEACDKLRRGQMIPIVPLIRTFLLEAWLKSIHAQGISTPSSAGEYRRSL